MARKEKNDEMFLIWVVFDEVLYALGGFTDLLVVWVPKIVFLFNS